MSVAIPALPPSHRGATTQDATSFSPVGGDLSHVTFSEVLSALNPLQYVPVLGMIYRRLTGDTVSPVLRATVGVAESLLLGGPAGLAGTLIWAAMSEVADSDGTTPNGQWKEAATSYGRASKFA